MVEEAEKFYGPHFTRLIIHVDMDCYYAQVLMKAHNLDPTIPMGVLQWKNLIALNYPAKKLGITRQMSGVDALEICP